MRLKVFIHFMTCWLVLVLPVVADESIDDLRTTIAGQMGFELEECTEETGSPEFRNTVRWCGASGLDFPEFKKRWKQTCQNSRLFRRDSILGWNEPGPGIRRAKFFFRYTPGYLLFGEEGGLAVFILSTALTSCNEAGFGDRKESGLYATADTPGIEFPKRIHHVSPEYPESARIDRREDRIVLEAIVTTDGRLDGICILDADRGDRDFELAAVQCVESWVYEPAVLDGKPVDFYTVIQVSFDLHY